MPVEVENPIRFTDDRTHASYDPEYAHRLWRILVQADDVFRRFRASFLGKCSSVHFFWGSFDLAVTRFSGRRAPERPGADRITREAYSHAVISAGFSPGRSSVQEAACYAYAAPGPAAYRHLAPLPHVAVRAEAVALDDVALLIGGREDDDRQEPGALVGADAL